MSLPATHEWIQSVQAYTYEHSIMYLYTSDLKLNSWRATALHSL